TGCSAGGRQALIAAQRYPEDFDGIVAGAPALNATGRAVFSMWVAQNLHNNEEAYIPATKYAAIHNAVLEACDALDGVKDRVIENPLKCTFNPKVLACTGAETATCLTEAQVDAARKMYLPVVNTKTKKEIFPGLAYGSELGWATFGAPQPFGIGAQMFQYHGWADPQIPSASSTQYYQSVLDKMGSKVTDSYRLFMVPGMNHCGGGDGTATFDMLAALESWVEK